MSPRTCWKLSYCACVFLLVSCEPAKAKPESVSKQWDPSLEMIATPKTDKDGRVYAVKVELANRSKDDIALFRTMPAPYEGFFLSVADTRAAGKTMTWTHNLPAGRRARAKIHPNKTASFCLKLEDDLLPGVSLDRSKSYDWVVWGFGRFAWTPIRPSLAVAELAKPDYWQGRGGQYLQLGIHKSSIQKNMGCD